MAQTNEASPQSVFANDMFRPLLTAQCVFWIDHISRRDCLSQRHGSQTYPDLKMPDTVREESWSSALREDLHSKTRSRRETTAKDRSVYYWGRRSEPTVGQDERYDTKRWNWPAREDSSTWSFKLQELIANKDLGLLSYDLELNYDYWTYRTYIVPLPYYCARLTAGERWHYQLYTTRGRAGWTSHRIQYNWACWCVPLFAFPWNIADSRFQHIWTSENSTYPTKVS
jgi:hypothetical protein